MTPQKQVSVPKDPWHSKYFWDLEKVAWHCARCHNCKWVDSWEVKSARFAKVCPSSAYYYFDGYSCQGRMDATEALVHGEWGYDDSRELLDVFLKCNMCGGCDANCKRVQDMEPLRVIQEMRHRFVSDGQLLPAHAQILEGLRREDNMMAQPKAARGQWADGLKVKDLGQEKAEVVFHAGCVLCYDRDLQGVARQALGLIQDAGVDVGIMSAAEACCGGRADEMGYRAELTKYAEHNLEAWRRAGVKTLVTSCADCYHTFKRHYPELGSDIEVLHTVEFLRRLDDGGGLKLAAVKPLKVTYHDSCHLGRLDHVYVPGQAIMGVYDAPREILKAIPGVELVEMERIKENAWCCGAGAGVRETYPDFNAFTAQERILEAEATGADAIVTACGWCQRNFLDATSATGSSLQVLDLTDLVNGRQG